MPGLVAGRRELMAATQANLEPIFLIYDGGQFPDATDTAAMPTATEVMDAVADERAPLVSITTEDGITHRLWRLGDPGEQAAIAADLSGRRALIADGHHRYAAYLQLQAEMRASPSTAIRAISSTPPCTGRRGSARTPSSRSSGARSAGTARPSRRESGTPRPAASPRASAPAPSPHRSCLSGCPGGAIVGRC